MNEEFEIKSVFLGIRPFVLVEFTEYDEDTGNVGLSVEYGGGISREEVPEVLDMVRESVQEQLG